MVEKKPKKTNRKNNFEKILKNINKRIDKVFGVVSRHLNKFLVSRWSNLLKVSRPVVNWLIIVLILTTGSLIQSFLYRGLVSTTAPVRGDTYAEGVVDRLTTISPLYAKTDTEKAASQLVYAGLLSYDSANKLKGQLAKSWSIDNDGAGWSIKLKKGVQWSDGTPLTPKDVVFTVNLMKKPEINPNLSTVWKDIEVKIIGKDTVRFTLPSKLAFFDTLLTFGILPQHILDNKDAIKISQIFSQRPKQVVGSGPLTLYTVEKNGKNNVWHFKKNTNYYSGSIQVDDFIIHTFQNNKELITGFKNGIVNAISNVPRSSLRQFKDNRYKIVQLKTSDGIYAIFNTTASHTSDIKVREALRLGLNRQAARQFITRNSSLGNIRPPMNLDTPIATGVYGSIDRIKQPAFNEKQASELLDQAGWKLEKGQTYRQKDGKTLIINIITIAGTKYEPTAHFIAKQWRKLGVDAKLNSVAPSIAQQKYLSPRDYDVLVYAMHLGADPDMYSYWSLTQTPEGANLANYTSKRAELALTAGRTNSNPIAREARYKAFVSEWLKDVPAIALYQSDLFYVQDHRVDNFKDGRSVIDASNRLSDIQNWTVKKDSVFITP